MCTAAGVAAATAAGRPEKTMSMKTALYWFRGDLRVADNEALLAACRADRVLAAYCFDPEAFGPGEYGFPKTGPFRARFLLETVADLREQLRALNIPLYVFAQRPEEALPGLVRAQSVTEVHLQREWTRDECRVREAVREKLPATTRLLETDEGFLFHPEDLPFGGEEAIPEVFTAFRRRCEKETSVRPVLPEPKTRPAAHWEDPQTPMPGLADLGFKTLQHDPRSAFPFHGGTTAARARIRSYFWDNRRLSFYKHTRNGMVHPEYSTKLSPWLANGSLSARQVYWETRKYEEEVVRNQDTYWLIFELIWRDYFRYISRKHGNRIFYPGGILGRGPAPPIDPQALSAWTTGHTASDFINANMVELSCTGWMSNRGRQNAASYWTRHLRQDWRIGAAWFEYLLVDYDVHSNWGNWMYNSGVGNDPRDRTFNPETQAARYDADGRFRRLWLQPTLFETGPSL